MATIPASGAYLPKRSPLRTVGRMLGFGEKADWQKVLTFVLVWAGAVIFALSWIRISNVHEPRIWTRPDYDLHHGYTYSLILLLLPLLALGWWYHIARKEDRDGSLRTLIRAVIQGSLVTALLFVVFDAVFASLLFEFPDQKAVLGVRFPGYEWDGGCSTIWQIYRPSCYSLSIPIEEVAFYLGGAAVLRGMYIWASEDFFKLYTMNPEEYASKARKIKRLLSWNWKLIALMLLILAIGVYAKRQYSSEGYPVYLFLQVLIISPPVVFLYTQVKDFINTRALLMVMVLQALVSVIWEATAAVPYGWWAYKPAGMSGLYVRPWSELPIEACLFWIGVGWSAAFIHEATKIKIRSNRSWRSVLLGDRFGKDSVPTDQRFNEREGSVLSPG
jgi:hypothetical protein